MSFTIRRGADFQAKSFHSVLNRALTKQHHSVSLGSACVDAAFYVESRILDIPESDKIKSSCNCLWAKSISRI